MSRIMVLGGGSSQRAAIVRCKEMGHRVIVADADPRAPGAALADEFVRVSTFDAPGVSTAAARLKVEGIVTLGSDQPVLTQAIAAARLGLPGFLSPLEALRATNKKAMKHQLARHGVPVPLFTFLSRNARSIPDSLRLPAVIKPLDSQGQRGIFYLSERSIPPGLIAETLSFSREDEVIAEEFHPGGEVTLSGRMQNGTLTVYSITDRVTRHALPRLGVCFAHRYPSRYETRAGNEIRRVAEAAMRALEIDSGPVYIQLFAGEAGVVINEVACRLGGAYEDEFIPLITGVDILGLVIREYSGEVVPIEETLPRIQKDLYISVPLLFCRQGVLASWKGLDAAAELPGVRNIATLLVEGTSIGAMKNSTQRAAYAVISGSSPQAVNQSVDALFTHLKALDPGGTNLLIDSRHECSFPPEQT